MKKWLRRTLAIMLIAVLMPVTSSFAVEESMTDFNEVNSITAEDEIVKITEEDGLSVIGWSSYAENEMPYNAIDGNYSTIWQSNYEVSDDYDGFDKERYLTFDLGKEYFLSKVIYYPRILGDNGKFQDCDIYVSTDNSDWYLLKSEKNWGKDTEPKEVVIENLTLARYVKVVGVNTYLNDYEANQGSNENRFASAAEIEFFVKSTSPYDCVIERANGNYYGSFADAVKSAQNGETVKLLRDVELSQQILIKGKKITIDGHNGGSNFKIKLKSMKSSPFVTSFKEQYAKDTELTIDGVTIDGGAVWFGDNDSTLQRGTTNTGETISASLFSVGVDTALNIIGGSIIENNDLKYESIILASISSQWNRTRVYIKDSVIRNNSSNGTATVLYTRGATSGDIDVFAEINNSQIYGNQNTSDYGSIIAFDRRCSLNIFGGSICNNHSKKYGGAIYLMGGAYNYDLLYTITIGGNAKIENNRAQYGGAFYLSGSKASLNLNDCTVRQNYADSDGGAIYVNNGTVSIDNNVVLNNNSANNSGGAIYISDGTVNIDNDAKLENNNANKEGGAVCINGGVLNLNKCQFNNNISQGTGGAISMITTSKGIVNLGNASFSGNSCQDVGPYGSDSRKAGNAIYYFGGTLNLTGQPILSENDDIYSEYNYGWLNPDTIEKIVIKNSKLEEKSIVISPFYSHIDHVIAEIDPSIQDTVDRQSILKAFYFPKELNLGEKAVYIKENEIFYGDPVNCTKDIPQTMIKFTKEENTSYDFQLSVEATGTDITYKWYESDTVNGTYTLMENETKNTLNITGMGYGKKYYYCEIDNGELSANGPYKSTICKVEVSEFYPCSQAIDKFERV